MHYRHGDLLITKVKKMPQGEAIKHNGTFVLAEGEVTGHMHTLHSDKMKIVKTPKAIFMKLEVPTPLKHQEHKEIEILPGIYKLSFELEYDPLKKSIRRSID